MLSHRSLRLGYAVGLLGLTACARMQREVATDQQPCMFSEAPKSSLSWQSGPGDFTLRGRAVSVRDGRQRTDAAVRLSPGGRVARADSTGVFELRQVRGGRYFVEVLTSGGMQAADSITIGDNGVQVLAAIAEYTPDLIECVRLAPGR